MCEEGHRLPATGRGGLHYRANHLVGIGSRVLDQALGLTVSKCVRLETRAAFTPPAILTAMADSMSLDNKRRSPADRHDPTSQDPRRTHQRVPPNSLTHHHASTESALAGCRARILAPFKVLAAYQRHYNGHRPHRARNQLPPDALPQPATVHDLDARKLLRTQVLSGAINEYRYAA